jgi:hypothetical protein
MQLPSLRADVDTVEAVLVDAELADFLYAEEARDAFDRIHEALFSSGLLESAT